MVNWGREWNWTQEGSLLELGHRSQGRVMWTAAEVGFGFSVLPQWSTARHCPRTLHTVTSALSTFHSPPSTALLHWRKV